MTKGAQLGAPKGTPRAAASNELGGRAWRGPCAAWRRTHVIAPHGGWPLSAQLHSDPRGPTHTHAHARAHAHISAVAPAPKQWRSSDRWRS
eukprot:5023252-Pyramimonas_sp.AAC.1